MWHALSRKSNAIVIGARIAFSDGPSGPLGGLALMSDPANQPPPAPGPEAGPAKPNQPGPQEPKNISASILPQRKRDAAKHPGAGGEPDTNEPDT
jgi:hypothetical protein